MRGLLLICVTIALFFNSCDNAFHLREGDLLFQDLDCGPMCEAIEAVTYGRNGYNLSHIALVVKEADSLYALEAISNGVVLTPIHKFLRRSLDSNNNPKVFVGRLNAEHAHLIKRSVDYAKSRIGYSYDDVFLMNNEKYYCSELLYEAFTHANNGLEVFHLNPMTFKPNDSADYFSVWKEYYDALGETIPEGKPGLNPAGMSLSEYIHVVHHYGEITTK